MKTVFFIWWKKSKQKCFSHSSFVQRRRDPFSKRKDRKVEINSWRTSSFERGDRKRLSENLKENRRKKRSADVHQLAFSIRTDFKERQPCRSFAILLSIMFAFYALSLLVVFLGIIINLPGSLHINPLLLHFYEPSKVLFLTTIFLLMGAIGRIIVFWKEILWEDAILLSVYGIVGGFIGGYMVGIIPQKIIVCIFIFSGLSYLYTYFKKSPKDLPRKRGVFTSGFLTAFLQSFGLSVGPLRQGYLFSRGHNLITVQGTIAVVFLASGVGMISARLLHENIPLRDTLSVLVLFPFMLITMYIAKKVVYKIPKKIQDAIIIYSLILSLLLALPFLFK